MGEGWRVRPALVCFGMGTHFAFGSVTFSGGLEPWSRDLAFFGSLPSVVVLDVLVFVALMFK